MRAFLTKVWCGVVCAEDGVALWAEFIPDLNAPEVSHPTSRHFDRPTIIEKMGHDARMCAPSLSPPLPVVVAGVAV